MNIEKIRELVNKAEASVDADDLTETYLLLDAIRAELDKVQQPGKVLTDDPFKVEESEHSRGSFGVYGPYYSVVGLVNMEAAKTLADRMNWAYRLGRYNAPAAGLTVEEAETCMDEVGDPPDNPDHFWRWREKVSARLTAAIEAKSAKP